MQRYAKIPESIVKLRDPNLLLLWSDLYLAEVARQTHDHVANIAFHNVSRSRYYRILRRVRDYIKKDKSIKSTETRVRLDRDLSETRVRLDRDLSETQLVQTIPIVTDSKITKRDSSETQLTLERDSSETQLRLERDSTPLQVRREGIHIGLYKDKDKDKDNFYNEPRLKSDRELYEMTTQDRLRYIALNEQRLKEAGRL